MKKVKFLQILLLITAFVTITTWSKAQSVIGSWKKTDEVVLKENGQTKSTFKMLVKNMPCFADIVYTFSAGGKMSEEAKDCAGPLQAQIADELENSRWKMMGDKLILDVSEKSSPVKHTEYQVEFIGKDKMIWTFKYSENPDVPNITKAKQMQTTYVRIINY